MKKYIIDTNALISFVTDRNLAQQEKMAGFFEDATMLRCAIICPQHVLTEFVFVMERVYKIAKPEINAMVRDFIVTPGVEVLHEVDFTILLALWPDMISDFGDAIVAAVCKSIKGSAVITFDAKFASALKRAGFAVHAVM